MKNSRRSFIKETSKTAIGLSLFGWSACATDTNSTTVQKVEQVIPPVVQNDFEISLAQWSLHKALGIRGNTPTLQHLDFAAKARNTFDVKAIEYVNQFFPDKATDMDFLKQMNQRASDNGVEQLLIMIDREGNLAETDEKTRTEAIENHYKWVDAAAFLGCHSIRVNAATSSENAVDAAKAAVDGLGRLAEYGKKANINVIVENHGGFSSNGAWLAGVMKQINMPNCGTLPDFGNFCIRRAGPKPWEGECVDEYDRYQGVTDLMPYAKAVSAKAHDFNEAGNEIHTDFLKMMKIVLNTGYKGYVGIEYEGDSMSEEDGIKATITLLEKVRKTIAESK